MIWTIYRDGRAGSGVAVDNGDGHCRVLNSTNSWLGKRWPLRYLQDCWGISLLFSDSIFPNHDALTFEEFRSRNSCFKFLKIKRIIWWKFFVRDRIISRTMLWLQSKPCFQVMLKVILLLFARGQMMFATKPTIAGAALCIMQIPLTLGATTTTAVSASLLLKLYYLFVLLLDSFF